MSDVEIDAEGDRLAVDNPDQQQPKLGEGDELLPDDFDPEEGDD